MERVKEQSTVTLTDDEALALMGVPHLRIGSLVLCAAPKGKTWIGAHDGEGGEFLSADVERALAAFYPGEFLMSEAQIAALEQARVTRAWLTTALLAALCVALWFFVALGVAMEGAAADPHPPRRRDRPDGIRLVGRRRDDRHFPNRPCRSQTRTGCLTKPC
jgi:hypothetical protein